MSASNPLLAPIEGAIRKEVGGVQCDVVQAGDARVKRTIYWPGFRWETHLKKVVTTDLCMHAHVGMLVQGHVQVVFPDGCQKDFVAPAAVVLEPGHKGWVVGDEPAVLIEVDFEGESAARFGLPATHTHA
jgi:hypothetical protein